MKHVIILIFTIFTLVKSQDVYEAWVNHYIAEDSLEENIPNKLVVGENNNVYVSGYSEFDITSYDIIILGYNSHGETIFSNSYSTPGRYADEPRNIRFTENSLYVSGNTEFGSGSGGSLFTLKWSSSGNFKWQTFFYNDSTTEILHDANVGKYIYLTGSSWNKGKTQFITVKFDTSGNEIWHRFYKDSTSSENQSASVGVDHSGNVIVSGFSSLSAVTIEYTSDGDTAWIKKSPGKEYFNLIDSENNLLIIGKDSLLKVEKYNQNRELLWLKYFSDINPVNILQDENDDYIILCSIFSDSTSYDYYILKINRNGSIIWTKRYNSDQNGFDFPISMALDDSSNIYITGWAYSTENSEDFRTIKYNSSGLKKWMITYNSPYNNIDRPVDLVVDNENNVYVTGFSYVDGYQSMFTTVKYSQTQPTGIGQNSSYVKKFNLSQNYPNPFNASTILSFSIPHTTQATNVSINIFDINGRIVDTLLDRQLLAGNYSVKWEGKDFRGNNVASGLYFYQLRAGSAITNIKKMVLIR